ncbi:MAG: hypothetical protein ABWY71_01420, partial [Candidatus Saccharimonadales bacterium]
SRQCYERGINAPVLDALVWNNVKELLTQPELVFEQAKRWQEGVSPLQLHLVNLEERLKKLDESEARYVKMYGEGMMSEQIYKDNFSALNQSRRTIAEEMSGVRDELANKSSLPLEKLVDGVIKLVEDLDFSDKKQIIQKVVTKIIATKKEVTVWGHIPVLATEKASSNSKYDDNDIPNQSNISSNLSEIGLNASYRHCRPAERW